MDDSGDRNQDALPADGDQPGENRREFLKKAVVVGLSLPAAGALVGTAGARPSIIVRDRARSRFEGVTLQFAKAPFGTDEKDVIAKLLKPFTAKTGIKVQHTIVPWNVEGASYATNYAGPHPYDVSYQTSTDLTSLGTKGVLEDLTKWIKRPDFAADRKHFPNATAQRTPPSRRRSTAWRPRKPCAASRRSATRISSKRWYRATRRRRG